MSETTEIKGQFGLGQSGGTGKKLKINYILQMFISPCTTTKQKQLLLVNNFVSGHDLLCCCKSPAFHCAQIIIQQLAPELKEKEKEQLKQCLTTEPSGDTAADPGPEGDLDFGELEKLFEQDTEEETDG